jgi:hypothetical protein
VKLPPPPIRFLVAVVGCWVGARTLLLWSERGPEPPLAPLASRIVPDAPPAAAPAEAPALPVPAERAGWPGEEIPRFAPRLAAAASVPRSPAPAPARAEMAGTGAALQHPAPFVAGHAAPPAAPVTYPPLAPASRQTASAPPGRWSGSAWLFVRPDAGAGGLAPGGTLGGSQAGGRVAYRLNADSRRPLAVAARLYVPLERPQGAEAALGLDWQPLSRVPIHILAERRERIGREGRSDFALTLYAGGERRMLRHRVRVEAYGQAGVVGLDRPDLFADGLVRAGTAIGPLEVGAGAWGGAQPGAARLDIGPQASIRLPVGRTAVRASAEWRFRVAGDAAPDSGPAFTLSTDF